MQTDPISDMLTRVRNAQAVAKKTVSMPASKMKKAIADLLKIEGYIADYRLIEGDVYATLEIDLKYYQGKPVIASIDRVSRPGLRIYKDKDNLPVVSHGMGVAAISTDQGLMSDKEARRRKLGGEVLFYVN